jgi:hypothetical protein
LPNGELTTAIIHDSKVGRSMKRVLYKCGVIQWPSSSALRAAVTARPSSPWNPRQTSNGQVSTAQATTITASGFQRVAKPFHRSTIRAATAFAPMTKGDTRKSWIFIANTDR